MLESAAVCGAAEPIAWRCAMGALLVGYARCSTDQQDLTAQRDGLLASVSRPTGSTLTTV
jgi:hypothetical protein